jgi:uncharacterized protein YcaQ
MLDELRAAAVSATLFPETTLKDALARLGFVQADPIRAPARAQDLILRHRVKDYRAGDLERRYASLDLEEDLLYAYGFVTRPVWALLHPRPATRLLKLDRAVLARVRDVGVVHPRDLEAPFGKKRERNAWGGFSQATKRALERLHHAGLVRIARRENGIRLYEASTGPPPLDANERLRRLILVTASLLSPVRERLLRSIAARLLRWIPGRADEVKQLARSGALERLVLGGEAYLRPPGQVEPVDERVRFLAPFDPVVWDRARFEQLWGWSYRFEAYTPKAKRVRGYYAMPLLYGDRVIGWVNADEKRVQLGFAGKRPRDRRFVVELEAELARLRTFLTTASTPAPRL